MEATERLTVGKITTAVTAGYTVGFERFVIIAHTDIARARTERTET